MTMTKEEAIKWIDNCMCYGRGEFTINHPPNFDDRWEAGRMAIDALQVEPTHGRLIDADALMEYCSNQKTKTISNNDIARFPTVQIDRLHGEWVDEDGNKVPLDKDGCSLGSCWCSQCGEWLVGSDEYAIKGNFCPNCGAKMIEDYNDK